MYYVDKEKVVNKPRNKISMSRRSLNLYLSINYKDVNDVIPKY